jgi:hypothetical protein
MRASNIAVEFLYRGLLAGKDPRWVLHDLRQRLRIDLPETHDWASIVAYAAIAPDLDQQVDSFRSKQTKRKIEVKFARLDELVLKRSAASAEDAGAVDAELESLCAAVRTDLALWCKEPAALRDPKESAERWGMNAASEKRIAIIYALVGKLEKSAAAYRRSSELYETALKIQPVNHWVMTQFLSVAASPALAAAEDQLKKVSTSYARWWAVATQLAEWDLRSSTANDRVWAHGTLAELDLLGAVYAGAGFDRDESRRSIVEHCQEISEHAAQDTFPLMSTRRQFERYVRHWKRDEWNDLAQAALEALGGSAAT